MFRITILAVGKIKEKYWSDAISEYLKRLKPYAKINVCELKSEPFKRDSDKEKSKKVEAERIMDFLEKFPAEEVIILDERGKEFSSVEFAGYLENKNRHFIFVIGGALGFDSAVLTRVGQKMSLSKMTLPHELARVVLLEQLYRAVMISTGRSYHY
ncbi:MAG: 23S rRNA (pseudouridine(1915)-N(3))-methyltransferase RlmH [Patescibacteria group bacterium]|nr:23S rRNA (pseudouridine(1915)-N(3))-methyltransferase RlmH [Patescibacteria group bacterium]MDD5490594.1 23S rRNA (pseudouridine(1915)-N(3))-methyltransferase RlmH [Patescibacteria group bacterium]